MDTSNQDRTKRGAPRVKPRPGEPIKVRAEHVGDKAGILLGFIHDISATGMSITSAGPAISFVGACRVRGSLSLPLATQQTDDLRTQVVRISFEGTIQWRSKNHLGIQFTRIDRAHWPLILQYVAEREREDSLCAVPETS